jgi:hypothetical protein
MKQQYPSFLLLLARTNILFFRQTLQIASTKLLEKLLLCLLVTCSEVQWPCCFDGCEAGGISINGEASPSMWTPPAHAVLNEQSHSRVKAFETPLLEAPKTQGVLTRK